MKAVKGEWVEIENVILSPEERAVNLPEDTKKTPLIMWVRGFLESKEAKIGDSVEILTLSGRVIKGDLVEFNPRHQYDYGNTILELLQVGEELKKELSEVMEGEDFQ